jgi:hypothetical protein
MAIKFFDCRGYGQIEPNQVSFTRDGRIEAQCELDPAVFASHFPMTAEEAETGMIYGENGSFYVVDKANKIVTIPTKELSDKGFPMGICYSSEMIHNQFTSGRRNYCIIRGEYLPRLGYTEVGERLTLNGVAWNATTYTANTSKELYDAVKANLAAGTAVYAYVVEGSHGKLVIGAAVADALCGVYAQVVKCCTNADGSLAFMFQMVRKPTV